MSSRLLRDALAKTAKRSRQGRRNLVSAKNSNVVKGEAVLSAKVNRRSQALRQAQDELRVLSAKQIIARRLDPPREARSGTSRRNFFPMTLNTLRFECCCIEEFQRAYSQTDSSSREELQRAHSVAF